MLVCFRVCCIVKIHILDVKSMKSLTIQTESQSRTLDEPRLFEEIDYFNLVVQFNDYYLSVIFVCIILQHLLPTGHYSKGY